MSALLLAIACGVCIEDKVAATYDHALVQRALAQHHVVVYAEPRAPIDATRLKAVAAAAGRVPGVDAATVRTSAAPMSVSFVLDPRRASAPQALAAIGKSAGAKGVRLALLKVIDSPPKP